MRTFTEADSLGSMLSSADRQYLGRPTATLAVALGR